VFSDNVGRRLDGTANLQKDTGKVNPGKQEYLSTLTITNFSGPVLLVVNRMGNTKGGLK
jgi:hypothetical protein